MIKAINTAAGLGAYCIIYYVPMDFQYIQKSLSSLNDMGFLADVGYYSANKTKKSMSFMCDIKLVLLLVNYIAAALFKPVLSPFILAVNNVTVKLENNFGKADPHELITEKYTNENDYILCFEEVSSGMWNHRFTYYTNNLSDSIVSLLQKKRYVCVIGEGKEISYKIDKLQAALKFDEKETDVSSCLSILNRNKPHNYILKFQDALHLMSLGLKIAIIFNFQLLFLKFQDCLIICLSPQ